MLYYRALSLPYERTPRLPSVFFLFSLAITVFAATAGEGGQQWPYGFPEFSRSSLSKSVRWLRALASGIAFQIRLPRREHRRPE